MKKILFFLFSVIILSFTASAWTINNSQWQYNITNANITFSSNQTYTSIETGSDYISLNGYKLQLTPTSQVTIKINNFDTTADSYNLSITGTGTISIAQQMPKNSTKYNFYRGGLYFFAPTSNSTGWLVQNSIALTGNEDIITYPHEYSLPGGGSAGGQQNPTPTPTAKASALNLSSPSVLSNPLSQLTKTLNLVKPSSSILNVLSIVAALIGILFIIDSVGRNNIKAARLLVGVALLGFGAYQQGWLR